jgi:hypothetical protein
MGAPVIVLDILLLFIEPSLFVVVGAAFAARQAFEAKPRGRFTSVAFYVAFWIVVAPAVAVLFYGCMLRSFVPD